MRQSAKRAEAPPARPWLLLCRVLLAGLLMVASAVASAAQQAGDWQAQVRDHVAAKDLPAALAITERRLAEAPQDLEARGWRARLLAWSHRWSEAEAEYRKVLETAPNDIDVLTGLADVLAWQERYSEALDLLDRAKQIGPLAAGISTRRGRALRALGRTAEARDAFSQALAQEPANTEARAGLESLEALPRHEFRFGADTDLFNYTEDAQALSASLRSQLSSRWTTNFSWSYYQRFWQEANKFTASASYRVSRRDTLTAGGAFGRDRGVIPKREAFFEYGHGFNLSSRAFVRGLEANYRQHWLWFRDARVLVLAPSVTFYLPRDWTWSVQIMAARSRFPAAPGAEWRPSGSTRLSFPVTRRVRLNAFYGVGTENFAQVDQIGCFSARTFGAGWRYQFAKRHEFTGYALYQDRSQGRSQTSFGLSYAIRF